METIIENTAAPSVDVPRLVRHVCGSCIYRATREGGGWGRFSSPENPRKTDWCAVCDHRAEGLEMPVYRGEWGNLRVLPNAQAHLPAPGGEVERKKGNRI